ncbi:MAG TPA: hypothetical protein VFX12_15085 [Vicinamibacterales bacterium]|nr:hypothetical protein [Vicinamibacterales bacterium]
MSLLEHLGRRGHLSDRQFARVWTEDGRDPHLQACPDCQSRYQQFTAWLDGVGDDLHADADAAFPAERLAAQQIQIARRIDALEHPVRILAFPRAARAVIAGQSHARRWVAAAAAASFIAGIGIGQMLDLRHATALPPASVTADAHLASTTASAHAIGVRTVAASAFDEDFLMSDGDTLARPRIAGLRAIDDLTPRARDLVERASR